MKYANFVTTTKYGPDAESVAHVLGRCSSWANKPSAARSPLFEGVEPEQLIVGTQGEQTLMEYRNKIKDKWWGPQGLTPTAAQVASALAGYYPDESHRKSFIRLNRDERRIFRFLLRDYFKSLESIPVLARSTITPAEIVNTQAGNSGGHLFTKNKDVIAAHAPLYAKLAIEIAQGDLPCYCLLQWYRSQRNKIRAIFGDDIINLTAERATLTPVINTAQRATRTIAYRSEATLGWELVNWLRTVDPKSLLIVEGDVDSMDHWVVLELALYLLSIVLEDLPHDSSQKRLVTRMITKLFEAPVCDMFGDVHVGKHSLFSGMFITNGIENLASLAAAARFIYRASGCTLARALDLAEAAFVLVKGDDVIIYLNLRGLNLAYRDDELTHLYAEVYESLGMAANPLKQRVSRSTGFFCKHQYPGASLEGFKRSNGGGVIPIYPVELAINSCIYPETGPALTPKGAYNPGGELAVVLSKLDVAVGDPNWGDTILRIAQLTAPALTDALQQLMLAPNAYVPSRWETKVYGAPEWSFNTSPSARELMRLKRMRKW